MSGNVDEIIDENIDENINNYRQKREHVTIAAKPKIVSHKIIIPYNLQDQKYWINSEIEKLDINNYVIKKLEDFNNNETFKFEKMYSPKGILKILMYSLITIIFSIAIYVSIVFSTFFAFNPIIIFTIYTWLRKGYNLIQKLKYILFEKFRIKDMHRILSNENSCDQCKKNGWKWELGESGVWLEVNKLT